MTCFPYSARSFFRISSRIRLPTFQYSIVSPVLTVVATAERASSITPLFQKTVRPWVLSQFVLLVIAHFAVLPCAYFIPSMECVETNILPRIKTTLERVAFFLALIYQSSMNQSPYPYARLIVWILFVPFFSTYKLSSSKRTSFPEKPESPTSDEM